MNKLEFVEVSFEFELKTILKIKAKILREWRSFINNSKNLYNN